MVASLFFLHSVLGKFILLILFFINKIFLNQKKCLGFVSSSDTFLNPTKEHLLGSLNGGPFSK